ncbi:helix-turn-helix domain-containing protein [Aestuariivirga sp.]|uniref:helix-turn-helix domain-containing protein n=1 Tax=Aestuariivirga sp. TaxID=2650926 RepID=UPI0039E69ED9
MTAIRLFKGGFGHVSLLRAAGDLVTHAHPECHIILWLAGNPGAIQVGPERVVPDSNIAVGVNSLQPHGHCFANDGAPGNFLAFYIDPRWIETHLGIEAGTPVFPSAAIPLTDELRGMIRSIIDHVFRGEGHQVLREADIEYLIETIVRGSAGETPSRAMRPVVDWRIRKAIAFMSAHVEDRVCFDALAQSVGLSRPHFFALFKEQTNLTPNLYWNTLRMEEALRQVEEHSLPLTAVACNLGFTSQGNFTRFFRDHTGVPPTLYRDATRPAA